MRTATTRPYIAMIPAMTTGMMDFMISSGRITDMAAIPVPLFAVPYAAPNATQRQREEGYSFLYCYKIKVHSNSESKSSSIIMLIHSVQL